MLSFASFGANRHPECVKVAKAVDLVRQRKPNLEIDGEMQADVALNAELRKRISLCDALLERQRASCFGLAAANIAYKMLAAVSGASLIGPILVGMKQPANVLQ